MSGAYYSMVPKGFEANLRFRKKVLDMARDLSVAAQLKTMCASDILFYVNVFGWTYDPRSELKKLPFITYPFQDDAMLAIKDCIEKGQDFTMPKSRDMGASWMGLVVFEWFWHFVPDTSFLLISRNEDYVDKRGNPKALFWKIDFFHENQPNWLLPTNRWLGNGDPGRKLLHLRNADNGSVIDGESTTGDAGRGDRRTAMFIDEHAAFNVDDGFRVLRATRDTTRCRGFNSTPQGANNAFYEVCHNTAARMIRLHWSQHPEKSAGLYTSKDGKVELLDGYEGPAYYWKKGEKEPQVVNFPDEYPFKLDGKLRSPWYDAQCARCANEMEVAQELDIDFLGSDYQFFDPETIDALRKKHCRTPLAVGNLEFDPMTLEPKRFVEDPKGKMSIWLLLDRNNMVPEGMKFVVGADVSAGTGASNSAASVVDRATGEKVALWKDPHTLPKDFARVSVALARFFNRAQIVPDRSGPTGEVYVKTIMASGYGNLYFRRQEKKIGRDWTDEPGVFLNPPQKTALLEDYRDALNRHRFINRSESGMMECLQFIRRMDGTIEHSSAANTQDPSGARTAHGDEVIADALACLGVTDLLGQVSLPEPEIPENCLAMRIKRRKDAELAKAGDRLGEGW